MVRKGWNTSKSRKKNTLCKVSECKKPIEVVVVLSAREHAQGPTLEGVAKGFCNDHALQLYSKLEEIYEEEVEGSSNNSQLRNQA